jgi:predicted hydrocarbon binding protein
MEENSQRKMDNFSMRIYLETIEAIVGYNGLMSILNYAHLEKYIDNFPPDNDEVVIPLQDVKLLCRSLLEMFGRKGCRNLELHIGRENVKRGLEKRPGIAKAMHIASLFVPETIKMRIGLEKVVENAKKRYTSDRYTPDERVVLKEEKEYFLIIDRDSWESEDIIAPQPVCHIYAGTIAAVMEWITGHEHAVREIECRAMGHPADVFKIEKAATAA